ncbi:hypothetical protein NQ318_004374 [Aromia moschata]|uniref:ADP-ribosylation factor-like protein 13B n=1 Tax=Aromia moschata TaxID=1265417 RepID=A0AAV8YR90_9CUCU|nr:hypothetical protein NQ318_004374 [Aromia moschata]
MGNNCCSKRRLRGKIVLLLVGLDNAGKTKTAKTLTGDRLTSPVPTVGFSVFNLKYLSYDVKVFDLGGGPNIRGIWNKYFVDAHGVIFVVDSSDYSRFDEVKLVLEELLYDETIAGKPLLVLANKQDHENALDEIDVIEYLNIEHLVNTCKCPTLVQSCSASEKDSDKLDPGIQKGYEWLISNIVRDYEGLNRRVEDDVKRQEKQEREEMLRKIKRIKDLQKGENKNDDEIESYSDYARKLNGDANHTENLVTNLAAENTGELSDDSTSFPPVYHTASDDSALNERPKSAVQIVKHQLQLSGSFRKTPLRSRLNKTAPIDANGVKLPRSAKERRTDFSKERRNLKSADDCLFTITNKVPYHVDRVGPSGDSLRKNVFQLSSFEKLNRLPPLNVARNKVPWIHKTIHGDNENAISVVDVD